MIICNARVLRYPTTGVQRYTSEILSRLPEIKTICPPRSPVPFGQIWEQTVLPFLAAGHTLWSPACAGPLVVSRQVVTVHDLSPLEFPANFSRTFVYYFRTVLPILLPRVMGILTDSEFSRHRILETFALPENKVRAIPLGVDHERFRPQDPPKIESVRQRLNLPESYVLFFGTPSARKNVAGLIRAWDAALPQIPKQTHLVIAGGAGMNIVFGNVAFPTIPERTLILSSHIEDTDVPALLAGATAFAFPSLYEGFGLPPLEAMACGTPCLTSNLTSLPEVVGDAAITVNPLNTQDLVHALVNLLTNETLRQTLREKGFRRAAMFSWDDTATQTLKAIKYFEKLESVNVINTR